MSSSPSSTTTSRTSCTWPDAVDAVLHFASPASPVDYLEYPIKTMKVGAMGTHNMLGLSLAKGARFFLASTSEVYGDPQVHPQTEDYWGHVNPIGPRGVYDEAKRFAEALTLAYHRSHGLDVRIIRIFNTYGPRLRPADGRVVSNFLVQAMRGEPLTVYGDGTQSRSFCFVDDEISRHRCVAQLRLRRSGQHREPERVHDPRTGRGRHRCHRLEFRDRVRGSAGGRSDPTQARHQPGAILVRLGAHGATP